MFSPKKCLFLLLLTSFSLLGFSQAITPADSLGLPGDNLNLYAVLDLFQDSKTFEDFEKKLNEEKSEINNLDLNNDGKTDYIKVIDHKEGENHSIVLQIPVNENENQDVAVIEIEKDKDNKIKVQIVGNEDLYGKNYVIEPQENKNSDDIVGTINPAARPDKTEVINNNTTIYNTNPNNGNNRVYLSVGYWPMMGYMYSPSYLVYSSPWYWNRYPTYWNPWAPRYWHNYYWHHYNSYNHYRNYYHRSPIYVNKTNGVNRPRLMTASSPIVLKNRNEGVYLKSYQAAEKRNPNRINPRNNNPIYRPKNENINRQKPNKNFDKPRQNNNSEPTLKQNNNTTPNNKIERGNNKPERQQQPRIQRENKPRERMNKAPRQNNQMRQRGERRR